jgi:small-conductance mechanosensitive channel
MGINGVFFMDDLFSQLHDVFIFLQKPLVTIKGTEISFVSLILSFCLFILFLKIADKASHFTRNLLVKKGIDSGVSDSIERIIRYIVIIVGILLSLDNLGVSVNSLAAIGAVLMVGVGFGLQNITQNFISGIIILFERPIKIGDIITVGHSVGRVIDIKARSTLIETRDDITIIIPNSKIISEEVINQSYGIQRIRHQVSVGVAYGSDIDQVKSILLSVANHHPDILSTPEPIIIFANFGDSSLDFHLRFWSEKIWEADALASSVREGIYKEFAQQKVEIPFPQRVVHLQNHGPH